MVLIAADIFAYYPIAESIIANLSFIDRAALTLTCKSMYTYIDHIFTLAMFDGRLSALIIGAIDDGHALGGEYLLRLLQGRKPDVWPEIFAQNARVERFLEKFRIINTYRFHNTRRSYIYDDEIIYMHTLDPRTYLRDHRIPYDHILLSRHARMDTTESVLPSIRLWVGDLGALVDRVAIIDKKIIENDLSSRITNGQYENHIILSAMIARYNSQGLRTIPDKL